MCIFELIIAVFETCTCVTGTPGNMIAKIATFVHAVYIYYIICSYCSNQLQSSLQVSGKFIGLLGGLD